MFSQSKSSSYTPLHVHRQSSCGVSTSHEDGQSRCREAPSLAQVCDRQRVRYMWKNSRCIFSTKRSFFV